MDEHDDAAVLVEPGVEDEAAERAVGVARAAAGSAWTIASRISSIPTPILARGEDRARGVDPDDVLDLLLGPLRLGAGQVDLVEDRDDLEPGVGGEVGVRERLRLDALARVDDEERPLAGGERARHLVGEVDVARACRSG